MNTQTQITRPSRIAQIFRVALTFLLVFGLSFQLEIALATGYDVRGLLDDELQNLTVFTLDKNDSTLIGSKVRNASDTADEKHEATVHVPTDGALQLVAVPKWKDAGDGDKETKIVANDKVIEWYINDQKQDFEGGVFALTPNSFNGANEIKVTCKPTKEAAELISESFAKQHKGAFEVSFKAVLGDEDQSYFGIIEPSLKNVTPAEDGTYTFEREDEAASFPEQHMAATLKVYEEGDEENPIFTYSSDQGSLKEISDGKYDDLSWRLEDHSGSGKTIDSSIAEIDSSGLLKVYKDCSLSVVCATRNLDPSAADKPEWRGDIIVTYKTKGAEDPYDQGEDNPQSELKISGQYLRAALDPDSTDDQCDLSREHYPEEFEDLDKSEPLTLDAVKALPGYVDNATYKMKSGTNGEIGITGEGAPLSSVIETLHQDIASTRAIERVKFLTADGGEVTYGWSDLEKLNAILATKSYVHTPDSQADAHTLQQDKLGEEAQPLSNTCFRLLYSDENGTVTDKDGNTIDADRLRSIKEIVINPHAKKKDSPSKAPFEVVVHYKPVKKGASTTFSSTINGKISEYSLKWEESADEGKTWTEVGLNSELKVTVSDENIGHIFRVTATVTNTSSKEMIDPATGKGWVVSGQTVLKELEEDKIAFTISYNPPLAGDIAIFNVRQISGKTPSPTLSYVWEFSEDGTEASGWIPLVNNSSVQGQGTTTLKVKTTEASSDTTDEAGKVPKIRCRVIQNPNVDDGPWITDPVDLVVRPGDGGGGGGDNPDDPDNPKIPDPIPSDPSHPTGPTYQEIDTSALSIDQEVTDQIHEQEQAEQEEFEASVPGARWTEISPSSLDADPSDILGINPFMPFALPVALGITAAGGVEKTLSFRRQL